MWMQCRRQMATASDGDGGRQDSRRAFEQREQEFRDERDDRDHQHSGEHAVRIEAVLRGPDDQADAVLRAEHLADQRADDREAERGVQAGDDPGERGGHGDVPDDLQR